MSSDFGRTAQHIRGRVFVMRPRGEHYRRGLVQTLYGMEVINTNTGRVIASDNCTSWDALIAVCIEATAVARAAWFWGYDRKAVRG